MERLPSGCRNAVRLLRFVAIDIALFQTPLTGDVVSAAMSFGVFSS